MIRRTPGERMRWRFAMVMGLGMILLTRGALAAEITVNTVMVPMRDGVRLATDVYRSGDLAAGPVMLMRTPYQKDRARGAAERFAAAGYIAVVQDCRGKFASEGTFIPYNNEGQDGFDAIEWIGRQPWCQGRIGMWGSSYVGATQWQAAVEHPPGLATITPTATWTSFYRNLYLGGAMRHTLIAKWASGNSPRPEGAAVTTDWDRTLLHLPLSELDDQVGWPIPWLEAMATHPSPDGYWKRLDLTDEMLDVSLPIQHVVGYYDFFSRESVNSFVRMQTRARDEGIRGQQQLIVGPWDHGTIGKEQVGERNFGPQAVWDSTQATIDWCDRFVKRDPAALARPIVPVRYFVMGLNEWRESTTWPPAESRETCFYLHSGGKANTRHGDGRLDERIPEMDEPSDRFRADPANPAPACPVTSDRPFHQAHWAPVDQRAIEDREDVLSYTSVPRTSPLTFAGNVKAELHVAADTPDADWVVKLVEVDSEGGAIQLAVGILRGRFRDSELRPSLLVPNQTYQVTVDLGPVTARIPAGHRLRVDICGAYFPLFDRNPNTGEGPFGKATAVAQETVHHSPRLASCVVLPVVPTE